MRLLICLAVVFAIAAGPTTAPSTIQYGGVVVRSDAPEEVQDFFKLIPATIARREADLKEAVDELALVTKTFDKKDRRGLQGRLKELGDRIAFLKGRVAEAKAPTFRPPSTSIDALMVSGKTAVPNRIWIVQVIDDTTALVKFIDGHNDLVALANWPTTDILDDRPMEKDFRFVRSGTYRYATADGGQKTIAKYAPMVEDPDKYVIQH
jgi:hypothetical protein